MKTNIYGDFQICISVPLITFQQVNVYLNEPIKIHELIKLGNQSNHSHISCDYDQISKSKAHL